MISLPLPSAASDKCSSIGSLHTLAFYKLTADEAHVDSFCRAQGGLWAE